MAPDALFQGFLAVNVLTVILWFALLALRRNHENIARSLASELLDMLERSEEGEEPERIAEFSALAEDLVRRLGEVERRGPLTARQDLIALQGEVVTVCARFPEFGEGGGTWEEGP